MRKTSFMAVVVSLMLCSCQQITNQVSMRTMMVTYPETSYINGVCEVSFPATIEERQFVMI